MPAWLAAPAAILFCAVMALFPMAAGWAFKRWQPKASWRQALLFAALLAAAEWLRSWVFTGFPWLAPGYSQTPPSPLAGYAPILGVHGLTLLVVLCGALLLRGRNGIAAAALIVVAGFGLRSIEWTEPDGEPIDVALIQGNIAQEMKFRPEVFTRTLRLYRDLIADHPAQLTLLPETALPAFIDQLPEPYLAELQALAARRSGDLVIGTVTRDGERYFNSAVSLGSAPMQTYSKIHLVPFGEFIPPGFAWFMAYANIPMSSFSRGPANQPPLAVAGRQVAINICYEDAFGDEIIRALPAAGLLANLSNTAWFGRSLAQPQHLQIARMRALETGRPMLRATNTGMTAIVAADGNVQAALPPFTTGVLQGSVAARRGLTPYVRSGDWPFLVLATAAGLFGLGRRRPLR
jgi:apolipoprotein N-acyltransferase